MDLTDKTFESEVTNFKGVVLVDFWAEWCYPCKVLSPTIDELAYEYKSKPDVKFMKLNIDENPDLQAKFGIMSIPNLIIFKDGQPAGSIVGVKPKEDIKQVVDEVIAS